MVLTSTGLDNTRYNPTPTTYYTTPLSRSPRLLDPILPQGIGLWYHEAHRLSQFPGAKPRLFPCPLDLLNIDHGRLPPLINTAAGIRQPRPSLRSVGLLSSGEHRIACLSSRLRFT
jgi:hypothetical protein